MIGEGMNYEQAIINLKYEVLKALVEKLPVVLSKEYDELIADIKKQVNELRSGNDENLDILADELERLDFEREKLEVLKMANESLILIISAFYEKQLNFLAEVSYQKPKGSDGDSTNAKSIKQIKRNLGIKGEDTLDLLAGQIRMNFTSVRNAITHNHEVEIPSPDKRINDSYISEYLDKIYKVLNGYAKQLYKKPKKN